MEDKYLSVTALTKYIKKKFDVDEHLQGIYIRGEISNYKHHSRGHMYLTIKDENASIRAVMFQHQNIKLQFRPENGMKVLINGSVSVFEASGQYQLYINDMQPDGIGALHLAFEQLKIKLTDEGIFEERNKKKLPKFPKKIAVLTSPTGAAIRDILTTLERRYPIVDVLIFPILVQGKYAKDSIVRAIQTVNKRTDIDLIIMGRGGGSIEELWPFNEELVARAIFDSNIPIISAVGHETDFSISDFTADRRAATPTAAAELAVPSIVDLIQYQEQLNRMLTNYMHQLYKTKFNSWHNVKESYFFKFPHRYIEEKEQTLDTIIDRFQMNLTKIRQHKKDQVAHIDKQLSYFKPTKIIDRKKESVLQLEREMTNYLKTILSNKKRDFSNKLESLELLNPTSTMLRGYSILYDKNKEMVTNITNVSVGDELQANVSNGVIVSIIKEVKES